MWLELAGAAALWLAHFVWYVAAPSRARALGLSSQLAHSRVVASLRLLSVALAAAGVAFWIREHDLALGLCSAVATLTAAASTNTLVAPLGRRALLGLGSVSALLLVTAVSGWIHGP